MEARRVVGRLVVVAEVVLDEALDRKRLAESRVVLEEDRGLRLKSLNKRRKGRRGPKSLLFGRRMESVFFATNVSRVAPFLAHRGGGLSPGVAPKIGRTDQSAEFNGPDARRERTYF